MSDIDGLPTPVTEQAETVADVWMVFLVGAIVVWVFVLALVLYVAIRFRRRGEELPRQNHYNIPVEVLYTAIPLLIVAGLFWLTVVTIGRVTDEVDDPDLEVEVIAYQWQWEFVYPESGVVVRETADTNPELVLPAGRSVRFRLESRDVIHSFWVPGFLFKRDVFPDRVTSFDIDLIETTGVWDDGNCAEFCGLLHDQMRFSLRIVEPDEFDAWLAGGGVRIESMPGEPAGPVPTPDPDEDLEDQGAGASGGSP